MAHNIFNIIITHKLLLPKDKTNIFFSILRLLRSDDKIFTYNYSVFFLSVIYKNFYDSQYNISEIKKK
jgi:hypothetical protein